MITYSHVGFPTNHPQENETFIPGGKVYLTNFNLNPYGIEFIRFEPDSPLPKQMKTGPHLAFRVDHLQEELKNKMILIPPHSPWEGVTAAFIIHNGLPVEFMEYAPGYEPDPTASKLLEYHHIGVPTTKKRDNEHYLENYKIYHTNFDDNPFGIEFMRYEPGCTIPEPVQTVAHIAFKVKDLDEILKEKECLIPPNSPSEGARVAFISFQGIPVEFLEMR